MSSPEAIPRVRRFDHYAWVQFVDHEVMVGDPCPCGSRRLVRTHPRFARCPRCEAHVGLVPADTAERFSDEAEGGRPSGAAKSARPSSGGPVMRQDERFPLAAYSSVRFVARDRTPRYERLYGAAVDPLGAPVLIWVHRPLVDGLRPAFDGDPLVDACRVHRWPVSAFRHIIDPGRLGSDAEEPRSGSFASAHHGSDGSDRSLARFSNVRLLHRETLPGRERSFGHARDEEGTPVLLYVDHPLVDGARIRDARDPAHDVHHAYRWPLEPFGAVIDRSALASVVAAP